MTGVPKIASLPNFRDVAGPAGYPTPRGRMRRGQLFRSSTFAPSPDDLAALGSLRIAVIHDLRGRQEVELRPDSVLDGAVWRHSWVPGLGTDTIRVLRTAAEVRAAMINHYREFVSSPHKRAGIAAVLASISDESEPQVFHCSEGKDRTGWVAILLQCLAGVSDHDILADYLLTNELMRGGGDTRSLARVVFGDMPDDFFAPAMIADTAYLKAGMTQLEADYGTVEGYLLGGLGLSEDHLERLRTLLIR
jgi:protein-tyrosine phosphatase